jgi:sugar lactone lactonase YvrE
MQLPEGFDPSQMQLPEGMTLPEGFDPSQMQLPEGFDPSQMQLPEGMTLPEGFDPSQIPAMNNTIALFVYDLASGDKVLNIDLTNVAPTGGRFPNGITLDAQGNAYISDGAAGVIYRVDTTGGTAFLTDTRFSDDAGQLSGVAYHPNGYLIVAKSDGSLFKIPLDNPSNVQPVTVTTPPTRITGLALLGDGRLAALDNSTDTIAVLSSADDWANATTSSTVPAPENTVSITADDTTVIALTGFGGGIMALAQNAGADASTETTPSTITRITIP